MSRFLSSYTRLKRRLIALEASCNVSPQEPDWPVLFAMKATLPPDVVAEDQAPCSCGQCEFCASAKPRQDWRPGQTVSQVLSDEGLRGLGHPTKTGGMECLGVGSPRPQEQCTTNF